MIFYFFGEMNSVRNEWNTIADNEEIEIYKERLQEIEVAFRYNLGLLSDRDTELDVLEERVRDAISELERVAREKAECEKCLRRLNDEKTKEVTHLKKKIAAKDKIIMELDRKNEGNMKVLRKTLQELKEEHEKENAMLASRYEKQRLGLEKNFVRIVQLKEAKHSEELNELNRKYTLLLDELAKERLRVDQAQADNRNLRRNIVKTRKENEGKEKSYVEQIRQLDCLYRRVSEELEAMIETGEVAKAEWKETESAREVVNAATQTDPDREEIDRNEFLMMQEQNNVLKNIIKNLKKNKAKEREGNVTCRECLQVKDKIEEVNQKFESEVNELRKALAMDRSQRLEEENIIDSLETSVVCLKEKLIASLRQNLENVPDGDICSYTFGREIENEIRVSLMEDSFNRKMETILEAVQRENEPENLPEKKPMQKIQQDPRSLQRKVVPERVKPMTEGKEVNIPELTITKMPLRVRMGCRR